MQTNELFEKRDSIIFLLLFLKISKNGKNLVLFLFSSSPSVALTYDGEAQKFHCQCDGDCKTIEWIKDGTKLDDGQDSSTLPLLNGTGTYGCLVNEKIYQETFVPPIPTLEQPELKSNVGHTVLLGSNVTLTCRARSQATSTIMWMLDEYPYNCDQDDECVIGKRS